MAYVNTGTARSLKVSVNKKVGGNQVQGYPKTYDGQQSWGNPTYTTLTDTQLRQLSDTDFNTRYAAFVSYVESVEDGLDFDTDVSGDGASKFDLTLCGTTTTTTAAPVPTYAFSVQYGKYPVDVCGGTSDVVYSSSSSPGVGTVLYKDINLTQKWNVTNGEHIRFMSPVLYGGKAVNVSLTTGKILSVTTFSCTGIATTTTTTEAVSTPVFLAEPIGSFTLADFDGLTINQAIAAGVTDSNHIYQKYTNVTVTELQQHTPYGYTFYNDSANTNAFNGQEKYYAIIDTGISSSPFEYQVYINAFGNTHLWISL